MALFEATFYCPGSFSLKDKRKLVQSVLDRVRSHYNVAASEVDHQDHHRLTSVAFAGVGPNRKALERLMDHLENEITDRSSLQLREISRQIL